MTQNQVPPDAGAAAEREPAATDRSGGVRALAGAAIAIVGVLAAVSPENLFLRTLHQAMPQIADAIPAVMRFAREEVRQPRGEPPRLATNGPIAVHDRR